MEQVSLTPSDRKLIKVVVAGGGFAGVHFIRKLKKSGKFQITLVDRNNYYFYPPLLYQVATGFLDPSSISYPFRKLFRHKRVNFRMGEARGIDPVNKVLSLDNGALPYDYLVLATGCQTNFFGLENIQRNAVPMKTIDDALRMRNVLYKNLELAARTDDPKERKKIMTIVIAGGGPTGVEVSGMLAEISRYILNKDYPELAGQDGELYIVDGGQNLLGAMSNKSHTDALNALQNLGVKVIMNTHIQDFINDEVRLSSGETIATKTLIWAAGITANSFEGIPPDSISIGKRVKTDEYNKVEGFDDIFAIGDTSVQFSSTDYPKGHPQMAEIAIQQGNRLAKNFIAEANGRLKKKFVYFDEGELAVIGRTNAVADLFKHRLHFRGFIALVIWLSVHLITLVNLSNIFRTLFTWVNAYLSRDQSLRMIFRAENLSGQNVPAPDKPTDPAR